MVHLVTGYAGYAHIKSADDGAYNAAFFGSGQYVMESGNRFAGSIIDNNTVRILDGDGLMYGRHFRIEPNTYENLTIELGTAGKNRIDLICMVYEKKPEDETEKVYLHVIKGTETEGTPTVPEYTDGNILEGATLNQMPLYKATIEGVVLSKIEPLFETILSYGELAKYYYEKFEKTINDTVGDIVEIPDNVLAQVELNTAKLEAVKKYGECVYYKAFTIEHSAVPTNDHTYTTVHTFDEDFNSLLDPNGKYIAVITADPGLAQYIRLSGQYTIESDLQGCIWCNLTHQGYSIGYKNAALFPYTDDALSIDAGIESFITTAYTLTGFDIRFRPYLFQTNSSGVLEDAAKTLEISMCLELRIYQVGHNLDSITGGGELPDASGGTDDYSELDNKPSINGVTLEGNLTSEQLGLSGGDGAGSLKDLGVTASADELNYMAGATSNVQEQLNNKAGKDHTHEGYASAETVEEINTRLSELEEAGETPTTFVYSDTVPTEVAENTLVFVYE